MKKKILLVFALSFSFGVLAQGWSLKKNKDGIEIYTRMIPNAQFKEYKAVTYLETTISSVVDKLLDAPKYTKGCPSGVSHYVGPHGTNSHVFYAKKDLPWPVKDRDVITLLTVEQLSEKKAKLHLESLPEKLPELDKTIRIKDLMGFWLLEDLGNNTIRVTQQLYVNPEGSLPPIITNSLLIKGPFKTFTELKSEVAQATTTS